MQMGQGEVREGDSRRTKFVIQIFYKVICLGKFIKILLKILNTD